MAQQMSWRRKTALASVSTLGAEDPLRPGVGPARKQLGADFAMKVPWMFFLSHTQKGRSLDLRGGGGGGGVYHEFACVT